MNNNDSLSKYGHSFQIKVLAALLSDLKLVDTLHEIIDKKFFESEANKWIVEEILDYYNNYKAAPSIDVFKSQIVKVDDKSTQKSIVTQLKEIYAEFTTLDLQYIKDEFSKFCINQNLKSVIVESVDLLKSGNYDRIKELVDKAMKVGISSDIGTDYILDYDERTY
jgi:hypothetical protein